MASVASVYARAFADVILDVKLDPGQALTELRTLQALLAQSVALRRVWENPAIPAQQKRGLLDAIAERDRILEPGAESAGGVDRPSTGEVFRVDHPASAEGA